MTAINHLSKYLRIINPSDIEISEEKIFYREKYKEIIEYLKLLLTNSEDLEIYNYIYPKGTLLVNIPLGSDLIDYLKLISSNFYIYLIELKESEIRDNPIEFFENFNIILKNFDKLALEKIQSIEKDQEKSEKKNNAVKEKKKLFIINQKQDYENLFEGYNLLFNFLTYFQEKEHITTLLNNNFILIWIIHKYEDLLKYAGNMFSIFDYFISIPRLNKIERQEILKQFMEKNPEIVFELSRVVKKTKDWEVTEIKRLLKNAILKHYLNSELTSTSNEITDRIIEIIEKKEFIPYYRKQAQDKGRGAHKVFPHEEDTESSYHTQQESRDMELDIDFKKKIDEIKKKNYSNFMLDQLYENAAAENYNELVIIIDKLAKNEPLEDNDREILAEYPFVLNDNPSRAQINLEKAKKRIDLIKQSFRK
jgi:hypothetical protein